MIPPDKMAYFVPVLLEKSKKQMYFKRQPLKHN